MITAIVQYRLPTSIDARACAAHFRAIAPGFRDVPGLIRKQFIYANDGWAGGVYLWRSLMTHRRSTPARGCRGFASATGWIRRSGIFIPLR